MTGKEIIIVNDGSHPEERILLSRITEQINQDILIIDQANSGAAAALNNGIRQAKNELIILFDDDIIPESDTLQRHIDHHNSIQGSILCGSAYADLNRLNNDVEKYKQYMEEIWKIKRPDLSGKVKVNYENFVITTCNTSFSKNTFERTGGFDVNFRDGYDVEFGFRALQKEIEIYFDPSIKTIHDDKITIRYYGKRQKAYIDARKRIAEKYPALAEKVLKNIPGEPSLTKKIFYRILRSSAWNLFIETTKLKFILPRFIRYRLYGMTIAAISSKK